MKKSVLLIAVLCISTSIFAQYKYEFTPVKINPATSVKDQAKTGTCWCFATCSFIESELIKAGKGEYDLSEMFIVRNNYNERIADNYLRRGNGNINPGSVSHMFINMMDKYGLIPEESYNGINYDSKSHNHGALSNWIKKASEVSVESKTRIPKEIQEGILDAYLGKVPEKFTYKGKEYTPKSFYKSLGLNASDYVEITSFSHHPFYQQVPVEIPDNWDHALYYNVPIDELIEIMDYAIDKGYTIAWDGDISESSFAHNNHIALNTKKSAKGDIKERISEDPVDQESRQKGFENFTTTDDHLMHVTGIVKDQEGTKYYVTKNSWGTGNGDGYLNMSENYVKAKVIAIMVNKNAIPKNIRAKLNIK
jgi:Aminopeptidase C